MPEKRLSRKIIMEHLRKWLWLYLLGVAALCLANHLIYEVTRPRIPAENTLCICLVSGEIDSGALAEAEEALLAQVQDAEPSILAVEIDAIPYDGTSTIYALMQAKLVSGKVDIYILDAAGYQALLNLGGCLALDAYFESGQLTGAPVYAMDAESGESFIAAMDGAALSQTPALCVQDGCIAIAANGSAIESTLRALQALTGHPSQTNQNNGAILP